MDSCQGYEEPIYIQSLCWCVLENVALASVTLHLRYGVLPHPDRTTGSPCQHILFAPKLSKSWQDHSIMLNSDNCFSTAVLELIRFNNNMMADGILDCTFFILEWPLCCFIRNFTSAEHLFESYSCTSLVLSPVCFQN